MLLYLENPMQTYYLSLSPRESLLLQGGDDQSFLAEPQMKQLEVLAFQKELCGWRVRGQESWKAQAQAGWASSKQ